MKQNERIKMFVTKDGSKRISLYQQPNACNPRELTDEPLHCEDWSNNYSIMNELEKDSREPSARDRIIQLLVRYGRRDAIIDMLIKNGNCNRNRGEKLCDNALEYNNKTKEWNLLEFGRKFGETYFSWDVATHFNVKKDDIYLGDVLEACLDDTINYLCCDKYLKGVKMSSYVFDYYGVVRFYDYVDCNYEGICWLEKDEFLKYSGCTEEYWNSKSLHEIEFLLDELKAWSNNDVYGYTIENKSRVRVKEEYLDEDRDVITRIETRWKETDCCWGFYGDFSKTEKYLLEFAGFKSTDLDEI